MTSVYILEEYVRGPNSWRTFATFANEASAYLYKDAQETPQRRYRVCEYVVQDLMPDAPPDTVAAPTPELPHGPT